MKQGDANEISREVGSLRSILSDRWLFGKCHVKGLTSQQWHNSTGWQRAQVTLHEWSQSSKWILSCGRRIPHSRLNWLLHLGTLATDVWHSKHNHWHKHLSYMCSALRHSPQQTSARSAICASQMSRLLGNQFLISSSASSIQVVDLRLISQAGWSMTIWGWREILFTH